MVWVIVQIKSHGASAVEYTKNMIPALQWYDVVCIAKLARVCYLSLLSRTSCVICWLESCCASEAGYEHSRFGKHYFEQRCQFHSHILQWASPLYLYVPLVTLVSFEVQKHQSVSAELPKNRTTVPQGTLPPSIGNRWKMN